MIVRTWRGWTERSRSEEYLAYLERTGLEAYADTPGNVDVFGLRRDVGDRTEFLLITIWESMDAVKAFAGPDPTRSVLYPEDEDFLVEGGHEIEHFDIVWRKQA
jgi:heme-degrading monooxygenase HmoA